MPTYHIHLPGQVQGVGFRPYVYKQALKRKLDGWVCNGNDGVHIRVRGESNVVEDLFRYILSHPPRGAYIQAHRISKVDEESFTGFRIEMSRGDAEPSLLLTPDFGLCEKCRKEIADRVDRRYHYLFTTCIHCGPRYSLVQALPYDRERTAMADFAMCDDCNTEYTDPLNRRFHSQTNSCPECGIPLAFVDRQGGRLSTDPDEILLLCEQWLRAGKILAIKGIGGYILMADATNEIAIDRLRERKRRPTKPFALMYPEGEYARGDVIMSAHAWKEYRSVQSPIVLGKLRENPSSGALFTKIAPGLDRIGLMQPYTPFYALLMERFDHPMIATSGNLSGSPIFFRDGEAVRQLGDIADAFITNEREIMTPQDDSLVAYSPAYNKRIVLRRSRGYAPTYILPWQDSIIPVRNMGDCLAMGAEMKSSFALLNKGNFYISQYLGDLKNFESERHYQRTLEHLMNLLHARPQAILVDAHPHYYSSRLGRKLAEELALPLKEIQHHMAHFAAVLAENSLLDERESVLGVVFDGTGWGDDRQIWGGEFFLFEEGRIDRKNHIDYFSHLLGDKMAKEPRISALSLLMHSQEGYDILRSKFTGEEWDYYEKLCRRRDLLKTSSVGRLFDAAASVLLPIELNGYEGEAAMKLEALARTALGHKGHIHRPFSGVPTLSSHGLIRQLAMEMKAGSDPATLALRFHETLVAWIEYVALREEVGKIAFSGGVFQNALLVDLLIDRLEGRFALYFHKELSPNDENIAFGQIIAASLDRSKVQKDRKKLFVEKIQSN